MRSALLNRFREVKRLQAEMAAVRRKPGSRLRLLARISCLLSGKGLMRKDILRLCRYWLETLNRQVQVGIPVTVQAFRS